MLSAFKTVAITMQHAYIDIYIFKFVLFDIEHDVFCPRWINIFIQNAFPVLVYKVIFRLSST